jgi:hypothetical protein
MRRGVTIQQRKGKNRQLALAASSLLIPASLMAFVLAVWRLMADMSYASEFAIGEGIFSHWHVWVFIAVILIVAAVRLNRYGRGGKLLL